MTQPPSGAPAVRMSHIAKRFGDCQAVRDASLEVMQRDAKKMRGARPFVMTNLRAGDGVAEIAKFIEEKGGLGA